MKTNTEETIKEIIDKIKSMSLKVENSIDKLPEDSEQNRVTNLLNENMVIGYQCALNDFTAFLKNITGEFPQGKENYCPRCYFEDEGEILRVDCKHNNKK